MRLMVIRRVVAKGPDTMTTTTVAVDALDHTHTIAAAPGNGLRLHSFLNAGQKRGIPRMMVSEGIVDHTQLRSRQGAGRSAVQVPSLTRLRSQPSQPSTQCRGNAGQRPRRTKRTGTG